MELAKHLKERHAREADVLSDTDSNCTVGHDTVGYESSDNETVMSISHLKQKKVGPGKTLNTRKPSSNSNSSMKELLSALIKLMSEKANHSPFITDMPRTILCPVCAQR